MVASSGGAARLTQWLAANRLEAAFLAFVILAFPILTNVYLSPPDSASYFAYARSLVLDRDLDFSNEYKRLEFSPNTFWLPGKPGGGTRFSNDWPAGCGLAWLPPFCVAHLAAKAVHRPESEFWAAAGYSGVYRLAINIWVSLLAVAALLLAARSARKVLAEGAAGGAVWLAFMGTPLVFYFFYFALMSHLTSFLFVSAFLAYWIETRDRRDPARYGWLGLMGGWAVMTRPQNVLLALAPILELISDFRRRDASPRATGRQARNIAAGLGAFAAGFAPQAFIWGTLYGNPFRFPKLEEMRWLSPALLSMLFSDYHGLLLWSPILIFVIPGLWLLWKRDRLVAGALALFLAGQTYLNAANEVWWAGGSFGNRRFVDYSFAFVLALAAWLRAPLARRPWIKALMAACVVWNVSLIALERGGRLTLERYVPFDSALLASFLDAMCAPWTRLAAPLAGDMAGASPFVRWASGLLFAVAVAGTAVAIGRGASTRLSRQCLRAGLGGLAILTAAAVVLTASAKTPIHFIPREICLRDGYAFHSRMLWDNDYELGYYYFVKGRLEEAGRVFTRAFVLWPARPHPLRYLATIRRMKGDPATALRICRFILQLEPGYGRARDEYWLSAGLALAQRPYDEAPYAELLRDAIDWGDEEGKRRVEDRWKRVFSERPTPIPKEKEDAATVVKEITGIPWDELKRAGLLNEEEFERLCATVR